MKHYEYYVSNIWNIKYTKYKTSNKSLQHYSLSTMVGLSSEHWWTSHEILPREPLLNTSIAARTPFQLFGMMVSNILRAKKCYLIASTLHYYLNLQKYNCLPLDRLDEVAELTQSSVSAALLVHQPSKHVGHHSLQRFIPLHPQIWPALKHFMSDFLNLSQGLDYLDWYPLWRGHSIHGEVNKGSDESNINNWNKSLVKYLQ